MYHFQISVWLWSTTAVPENNNDTDITIKKRVTHFLGIVTLSASHAF